MAKDKLRIGLIGYGYWGPNLLRNMAASAGARPVMVADMDQRRLDKAKAAYPAIRTTTSADELIKDPEVDAVSIATPVDTHFALAKAVLNAGKPVLVEKPFTSTVAQAEELIELGAKKG